MNVEDNPKFDDDLMEAAAGLAKEIAPAHDLWPGIEAAIAEPVPARGTQWGRVFAQAAAIVLMIGASSVLTWFVATGERDPVATLPSATELVFEPVSGSFGSQYNLGPDFQDAHNELAGSFEQQLANLPPETRAEVEKNIETIRTAIVEINKALDAEPDNALLQELLLSTYKKELATMIKVDGMTNAVMRRTDI